MITKHFIIETNNCERLIWLDWMKLLAILSIIWGHFFSEGHQFLYAFSVQTFCVISGVLYKRCFNLAMCISRCFWQLLVPTLIMSIILQVDFCLRYQNGMWGG